MSGPMILVVDDEPDIRALVKDILEDEGFRVDVAENAAEARAKLAASTPALVLLDIWMSDEDGISLLREWNEKQLKTFPVVMMSGHGTVETAVEATRLGADNFVEKPLTIAKLLQTVHHALKMERNDAALHFVRKPVGSSRLMQELREQARQVALDGYNLLIVGEQGSCRDMFARYIHSLSSHADAAFIEYDRTLNLAQLPEHATLFADLSETEASSGFCEHFGRQAMGNPRLMLAVHRVPERHEELFPRGLPGPEIIRLPPLRDHVEDVPEILSDSVDYHCQRYQFKYRKFAIAAQNHLLHYNWPGNLRELDGLVYALLQSGGAEEILRDEVESMLEARKADDAWLETAMSLPLRAAREMFERVYLSRQLEKAGGNVRRLADNIGMERTHLYRKLRNLGISHSESGK